MSEKIPDVEQLKADAIATRDNLIQEITNLKALLQQTHDQISTRQAQFKEIQGEIAAYDKVIIELQKQVVPK